MNKMILQLTPSTDITMTLVQFGSAIVTIGIVWYGWFTNVQRHKDHEREIKDLKDYNHMREEIFEKLLTKFENSQNDKIEELTSQFESKFTKLEDASKHFYKQLDAKTDKLENSISELNKLMVEMSKQLAVHLAQCDIKHNKK